MPFARLGRYSLIADLGRGGMAEVYLAMPDGRASRGSATLVVLKKPRDELLEDPEFVKMFLDEARIATRFAHPNIVRAVEVGESEGEYFLAMEYLEGQSLDRILERDRQSIPLNHHMTILAEALKGLHHAHELADADGKPLRIVHRDMSPHNLIVTYDGQVKILDFGIARAEGRIAKTRQGVVKGKLAYMAPEQRRGSHVDCRADIFSVGVMLFEAATRARFWLGAPSAEIARDLFYGNLPPSPRTRSADVHPALDRICQRALAATPDNRFRSADEFRDELEQFLERHAGGRVSARELGDRIARAFADERETTRTVIEGQLQGLETPERDTRLVTLGPRSGDSAGARPAGSTSAPSTSDLARANPLPTAPRERRRGGTTTRIAPWGWMLVLGLAGVAGFVAVARPLPPTPATSSSLAPAPSENVSVTLRATPESARFVIDDGPALPNPFDGTHARDGKPHSLRVEAKGFTPQVESVRFDENVSMRFWLAPESH